MKFRAVLLIGLLCVSSAFAANFSTVTTFVTSDPQEFILERTTAFGDIDGDGRMDVLFMVREQQNADYVIHIFNGQGPDWPEELTTGQSDIIIRSIRASSRYTAICANADVDDDGNNDLLFNGENEVYLFYGGRLRNSLTPNDADISITSIDPIQILDVTAGDINADGYDDIIIGLLKENVSYVHIFYNEILTPYIDVNQADLIIEAEKENDGFGKTLEVIGDINGDQTNELLVGAPEAFDTGAVYLYHRAFQAGEIYAESADAVFFGETKGDKFGYTIREGDTNGDKKPDIIVGAQNARYNNEQTGCVYIYQGADFWQEVEARDADAMAFGDQPGDLFGNGVVSINDLNQDGKDELLVGSQWSVSKEEAMGRLYLFYGDQLLSQVQAITAQDKLTGESAYMTYNGIIEPADDLNGDGFTDFFVYAKRSTFGEDFEAVLKVMSVW